MKSSEMKKEYSIRAIKDLGKVSGDGIFVYDLSGQQLVYCNRSFAKIQGRSTEELKGKSYSFFRPLLKDSEEYLINRLEELNEKSRVNNTEIRLVVRAVEKYVSVDAFLIGSRNLIVGIAKDVTAVKQHLNYIIEFGARKDALLDMVAHNLSGPLNLTTSVLNLVDQLNKGQQYKKIDHHLRFIRENTHQCIEVINSFLKEEHYESKSVFVKKSLFDVLAKVRIVVSRMKDFNPDKQIKIKSNVKELLVHHDDVKFFQIVHNLLSNAVKFTPAKGLITVEVNDGQEFFTIAVIDNGIGIPEHLHPYLFRKNTPASREGLKGEKSVGMGLCITHKLTVLMRGEISFKSDENKGATFVVRLPKE